MRDLKPEIIKIVAGHAGDTASIDDATQLTGPDAAVDSLAVVEILMALEELAVANSVKFTWDDDPALFGADGPFRTLGSLSEHFHKIVGTADDR